MAPEPAENLGRASLGPTAGPIVTELNNLLMVMNGHSEVALDALGDRNPVARKSVEEIRRAGDRAAHLMWELLGLVDPADAELEPAESPPVAGPEQNGSGETSLRVLLVEDNDVVRSLVHEMLEAERCEVLVAASPAEALELSDRFHGPIDLLVSDMVMPQMNGRELAAQILEARPGMGVLYTSRFANDALIDGGVIAPGTAFLQKPFSSSELASTVREVVRHRAEA